MSEQTNPQASFPPLPSPDSFPSGVALIGVQGPEELARARVELAGAMKQGLDHTFARFASDVRPTKNPGEEQLTAYIRRDGGWASLTYTRRTNDAGLKTTDITFQAKHAWSNAFQLEERPDGTSAIFPCATEKRQADGSLIRLGKQPGYDFDHNADKNVVIPASAHVENLLDPSFTPKKPSVVNRMAKMAGYVIKGKLQA